MKNKKHNHSAQFKAIIAAFVLCTDNATSEGIFQVTVQQFNIYRLTPCTGFWEYYNKMYDQGLL